VHTPDGGPTGSIERQRPFRADNVKIEGPDPAEPLRQEVDVGVTLQRGLERAETSPVRLLQLVPTSGMWIAMFKPSEGDQQIYVDVTSSTRRWQHPTSCDKRSSCGVSRLGSMPLAGSTNLAGGIAGAARCIEPTR